MSRPNWLRRCLGRSVARERIRVEAMSEKESDVSTPIDTLTNTVVGQLKVMEGFRSKAYLDTEGVLTIGYGTNLEALEIDELLGLVLMRRSLQPAKDDARILFPSFETLSLVRQSVLVNMAYNMGRTRLRGFVKFRMAVVDEAWKDAAYEMIDSKWARKDVGHRAVELAWMFENDKVYQGGK